MKKVLFGGLALLGLVLTCGSAEARGWGRRCSTPVYCEPACPPMAVTWVDKVVTAYKPVWHERDVPVVYRKPNYKDVVKDHKAMVMVPYWEDEKRTLTWYEHQPRQVEREVTRCHMVPVTCVDPCTGCTYTVCRPSYSTHKVKVIVYDCVKKEKDVMVKVCKYKQEEKTWKTTHTVCEWETVKTTRKERYCTMEPYQTTVKVPVYTLICPPVVHCH